MVRKICSVCHGSGKVRDPKRGQYEIPYQDEITCPNCNGEGFVGIPENFPIKKDPYKIQLNKINNK